MERYAVDLRTGCLAVIDRNEYVGPGLNFDETGVVRYWGGKVIPRVCVQLSDVERVLLDALRRMIANNHGVHAYVDTPYVSEHWNVSEADIAAAHALAKQLNEAEINYAVDI